METNGENLTAAFTGHRELPPADGSVFRALVKDTELAIQAAYADGVRVFYAGGAAGFDRLAGELVLLLKRRDPSVRLILLLPYPGYGNSPAQKKLLAGADSAETLCSHYYRGCFLMRDRELVERSGRLIAYLRKPKSGTAFTVSCARQKGIPVTLI